MSEIKRTLPQTQMWKKKRKEIIRGFYEQLHANKFENLDEIETFPGK